MGWKSLKMSRFRAISPGAIAQMKINITRSGDAKLVWN